MIYDIYYKKLKLSFANDPLYYFLSFQESRRRFDKAVHSYDQVIGYSLLLRLLIVHGEVHLMPLNKMLLVSLCSELSFLVTLISIWPVHGHLKKGLDGKSFVYKKHVYRKKW